MDSLDRYKDCKWTTFNHEERCSLKFNHCSFCHEDVENLLTHRCALMVALGVPFPTKTPASALAD